MNAPRETRKQASLHLITSHRIILVLLLELTPPTTIITAAHSSCVRNTINSQLKEKKLPPRKHVRDL